MWKNWKMRAVLVAVLTLMLTVPCIIWSQPQEAAADALSQYRDRQSEIQNEISGLRSDLKNAKSELNNYQSQLADADMKVQEQESLLEALESQLAAAEKELDKANRDFSAAQWELSLQLDGFKTRLRESYMNGDVGLLDVVFDATSMEDFITRSYYMERILLYDSNMIQTINNQIDVIKEMRAEQEKKISNLNTLTTEQKAVIAELEKARSDKAALVSAAQDDVDAVNNAIATRQKESEELAALIRAATAPTGKVGSGIYAWPLRGYSNVSSDYGWRTLRGKRNLHTGIDIPAPKGTPIYACDSGEVILARWYGSYGYCVIINHGNNMSTLYAHQSKLGCSVGDSVDQGDVIGYVGSTGNSTGNHLHLEVRKNGNHTSPWNYVSKP